MSKPRPHRPRVDAWPSSQLIQINGDDGNVYRCVYGSLSCHNGRVPQEAGVPEPWLSASRP